MQAPVFQNLKNPEKNHYVSKLEGHDLLLPDLEAVWTYFQNKDCSVDLGCGNGHFLQNYLQQNPEKIGLGIDLRYKRLFKTAEKLKETGSRVFYGDVKSFVCESPSNFWPEIWMMFPDPWPKKKHLQNRMIDVRFFLQVYRILKNTGRFCFISDHRPYWEFFLNMNSKTRLFAVSRSATTDLFAADGRSLFKRTFEAKQVPIYSLEFRKFLG